MAQSNIKSNNNLLWTGTWSSGSITVPNSSKYNIFLIYANDLAFIACRNVVHGNITGIGCIAGTASREQWIQSVNIETSGDTMTIKSSSVFAHYPSSNHSASGAMTIDHIYGII